MNPSLPSWKTKINALNLSLAFFVLAVIASVPVLEGSGRSLQYWANFTRFLSHFFPPDFSVFPQTLISLKETIQIAVMATLFSVILAIPVALLGAQNLSPRVAVWTARTLMNVIRTVPGLIWALIGVAIVGANPLAGVIGLTFYSIGYLGKFFSDAFESVDIEIARGLRAMGAGPIQAFQYGIWPHAKLLIWSSALWMFEYNIRSASIIGYVGAGGIGLQLHTFQEYHDWPKFAAVLLVILIVVTLLDLVGERIRQEITHRITPKSASSIFSQTPAAPCPEKNLPQPPSGKNYG